MKNIGVVQTAQAPRLRPSGPKRLARSGAAWAALALAAGLAACSSAPKPTQVAGGSIEASAQLNPSVNKRPSPLLLRVYELKSATAFNTADFITLFQKDAAELAADIVAREELTLVPGESRTLPAKTLAPDVKFIAVMGAFREIERAQWRSVAPVLANQTQRITIRAEANSVSVVVTPAK